MFKLSIFIGTKYGLEGSKPRGLLWFSDFFYHTELHWTNLEEWKKMFSTSLIFDLSYLRRVRLCDFLLGLMITHRHICTAKYWKLIFNHNYLFLILVGRPRLRPRGTPLYRGGGGGGIKTILCPSSGFKLSPYQISSQSVQRFKRDEVTDRHTFAFIILVWILQLKHTNQYNVSKSN
jgi:hypothetical protein